MNKHQYGAGSSGLPVRPSTANMPGPAPPLPPGPPPPQPPYPQQQQPQQDQAAHAAAWAAYYQSQAQAAGGAYAGPAQPAAAAGAANPYANYGYSALASAQHSAHVQQPQYQAPPAATPYRPPPAQTYPQAGPAQPYPSQPYAPGYPQQPQQYPQQYPQQSSQSYNWQQQGPPGQPAQQPYRPPVGGPGPQQPYYPQQNQPYSPVRPSPSPGPVVGQHRPYHPSPRVPSTSGRPPMGNSPSHPPAKRQRFDGPGGPPSGPANSNNNYGSNPMQNRPPQQNVPPVRPSGPVGNNTNIRPPPNFPVRPLPASLPSAPRSATGHSGSTPNKPNLPAPPVVREPIHMGFGPPPSLASSGLGSGGARGGGVGGGGRGGHAGPRSMRGGRGGGSLGAGLPNAPRGPAQMRRGHDHSRSHRERDRENNDRKRREKSKDVGQKEDKTTLTDFRIVGIEVKSLGWTWGQIGHEVDEDDQEVEGVEDDPVIASEQSTKVEDEKVKEEAAIVKNDPKTELETDSQEAVEKKEESELTYEVKSEALETSETVEKKRGEKRKAKTPEGDDDASSPKKRSGFHLLTHGKPNETSSAGSATAVHEFNQNRFRIYFESPAELDRVPKAMRRNPNKRWRRGTSSVAPALTALEAASQTGRESTVATQATLEEVGEEAEASDAAAVDGKSIGEATTDGNNVEVSQPAEEVSETLDDQIVEAAVETETAPAIEEHAQTDTHEVAPIQETDDAVTQSTDTAGLTGLAAELVDDKTAGQDASDVSDISMVTDPGIVAAAIDDLVDSAQPATLEGGTDAGENGIQDTEAPSADIPEIKVESTEEKPSANAVETEVLAQSAENTASAYKSRTRRRSSVSSNGSNEDLLADLDIPTPSLNRISILYQESQRRLCFDASVISSMTINRGEAKIDLEFKAIDKDGGAPKGVLAEYYDMEDQRFAALSGDKLAEFETEASSSTLPPFHRASFESPVVLTVYLNKKRPLSEPKWCRMNTADDWLVEQFGAAKAKSETGWMGKLKVADPDPPPTLQTILEGWASSSLVGSHQDRKSFTKSLQSDPSNLLEILLRLARGERNPSATASSSSSNGSLGPLATAIRADSPYASHQTHVSLAILAMYRLTTDYAAKAGEKSEVVNEKISDIIKSLPEGMIYRSLDGLLKEWQAK